MTFNIVFSIAAIIFSGIISQISGHLIMKNPVPFGADTLNNSPLEDAKPGTSGSDFPCKLRTGVYDITAMNNMKVGDTQLLDFTGSATHGGGTCQLAITTDQEPTANTTFELFQTFEGGCPVDSSGNTAPDPFAFVLPEGTPNGRLTLAWMWYNRIGNREIYMNCAPILVTGGSDSDDFYNSLPNAYVINLPTSECSTVETTAQEIPFPGQFITKDASQSAAAASGPSCSASAAAMTEGVSGYQSATKSNAAAYSAPASNGDVTGAATGAATQSATSAAGGSYQPASSQASPTAAAATSGAQAPSSQAAPSDGVIGNSTYGGASSSAAALSTISTAASAGSASSPADASSSPTLSPPSAGGMNAGGAAAPFGYGAASSSGSSSSGSSSSGSSSGGLQCNGPDQFGLTGGPDGKIVWQPVAPGTQCLNGQITKRSSQLRYTHVRRQVQNAGRLA